MTRNLTNHDEVNRPQFHYSAARGFIQDPEMTVYYAGEYHLGYLGCETLEPTAPYHWGHAVSGLYPFVRVLCYAAFARACDSN